MHIHNRFLRLGDWLWFLACGVASSVWCLTAARQLGATFDEPVYVERGLQVWQTGSHKGLLLLGTMPLPIDVQTLPLACWERLRHVHFDPVHDLAQPLVWARAGTLVFWWLLLAYGRLIGRRLGGAGAGMLAVGLLASEPNLLAHASLATTDIAVSACLLAFTYHFQKRSHPLQPDPHLTPSSSGEEAGRKGSNTDSPSPSEERAARRGVGVRFWLPAFWFAALVLSKASGVVFGVLCMLVIECDRHARAQIDTSLAAAARLKRLLAFACSRALWKEIGRIVGWGFVLVFVYCGCDWQPQPDFVKWAHHLHQGTGSGMLVWLAEHLRLFSNAGEGILRQVGHNGNGQGWFLLGRSGPHYVWYYFPVVLTVKLSLPLLLLPPIIALVRARCLANWACWCALTLLLLSVLYHVQIGVRYMFPPVCLAIVGLSAAVVCAAKELHGKAEMDAEGSPTRPATMRPFLPLVVACLGIVWTTGAAIQCWPNGLSYTNGLWGEPRKGYLLVSDSNYDWSQGLNELRMWQTAHPNVHLYLWYFGHDPARRDFQEILLHELPLHNGDDVQRVLRGHYLAVNTTLIYGGYPISRQPFVVYLRHCRPAAQTTTFLIYDFTGDREMRR